MKTPDGNEFQVAFVFKVDGEKLTGTVNGPGGDMPLNNGVVKGNEFSFILEFGENFKLSHSGKLNGDTIHMKAKGRMEIAAVLDRFPVALLFSDKP